MRKNILLSLGMLLAASAGTQAQVLMSEDFSAEQTKQPTEAGWYEFINTLDGDERDITADGMMHFYNGLVEGSDWQRAIKFRNLPIKENTSYRVSFKLMGDNVYSLDGTEEIKSKARFSLMQGGENLDMGFLANDGTQFGNDISYFQTPSEGKGMRTYTGMFYYSNSADHKAWYAENYPDKDALPDTWFLTINVYCPGDYYIDDVLVEEANVQGVAFNYDVIRLDFGYPVNTAALLNGQKRLLLPNDCAKVKMNGQEINVLTVEVREDGNVYVFLDDQYPETPDETIEVAFTNPTDPACQLTYAEGKAPAGAVLSFDYEKAYYDENINGLYSYAFEVPELVSADPEDGSFNLPVGVKEFKLSFDKEVDCSRVEATLAGERLSVSPAAGYSKDITLTRSGADLANGEYTLNVTKIYPEKQLSDDMYNTVDLTLNFGPVNIDPNDVAKVVWSDGFNANNYIPEGWTVYSGGSKKAPAESVGSGPRVMEFAQEGDFKHAFYFRTENANEDDGFVQYGSEDAEHVITLEGGKKYNISYNLANWSGGPYVKFELFDPDGNTVISRIDETKLEVPNTNASTVGSAKVTETIRLSKSGNYVFKWTPVADASGKLGGWLGCLLANIEVKYLPNAAGVEEITAFNTALDEAKAALEANSDERYAGEDYENLQAAITKYDGKTFTAPSAYETAVNELKTNTEALKTHRSMCDEYDPLVNNAKYARDQRTGTKYENHETYANIEAAIAKYDGKVLTDNAELEEAITELKNATSAVTNIERVVTTLTSSLNTGLATLKKMGVEDEVITNAVNNALSDDAEVKNLVKTAIYGHMNAILSDPANTLFAEKLDEATLENYVDSFDMSVFIENPELYCTTYDESQEGNGIVSVVSGESLPGWNFVSGGEGWSLKYHYPWGANAQYKYNPITCPVADVMIASWTYGYDIDQKLTGLPAGTYSLHVGVGDRLGSDDHTPVSYIFANTTDKDNQVVIPVIAGSIEPNANTTIEGIVVTDGQLTIGAHIAKEDAAFLNNFHLIMKAVAPGYNYVNGIAEVNAGSNNVVRTETYDLNGRRVQNAANGLLIVKKTMSDGSVVVNKQIIK